ncbi:hypothetical protein GCM10011608_10540 [Micromonospora sonchi]|uniref:Uncharacterized protein n=1 Tax=Micromonospora sonchi TaxID=1763543 RepID=A0A917WTD5_9ACTN|nr:hypothetical protein [Micromonospora sonchi]GGM27604.1 hypothetical protein GCM10011608_10540 [Micromonospora sonchi]
MSITITPNAAGSPEVNMANGNAAQVFDLLGLEFDGDWGNTTGPDFLGRVLLALALLDTTTDVEGRPEVVDGRWTEGGRRPGYLAERLTQLHDLALWAVEHDADVEWH